MTGLPAISDRAELPPRYYLGHFESLLAHVEALYPGLLTLAEVAFIDGFRDLSEPTRCLYVRLINRRPDFFRVRRLDYPEIPDRDAALAELQRAGLVEPLAPAHADELAAVLALFTRAELRRRVALPKVPGKPALLERLAAEQGPALLDVLGEPVVRRRGMDRVRVLKLLYFGTLHRDMDQFVIRDLGRVRFEPVDPQALTPYFRTRAQVETRLAIHEARLRFDRDGDPEALAAGYRDWHAGLGLPDPLVAPSLDRLTLRVARRVERAGAREPALQLYDLTDRPPARERRVRLLTGLGRTTEAGTLCERIAATAQSAAEAGFARDWLARRTGVRRRAVTRLLAAADTLTLDPVWRSRVEQGVLEAYRGRGWDGFFAENRLWRGLFGLLFWDMLFDPAAGALHHPLQRAPSDLFRPEFLARRREAIAQRLRRLDDTAVLRGSLGVMAAAKRGIDNPLVVWSEALLERIERVCTLLRPEQLRAVLLLMAENLSANGSGFPDLLVWRANEYAFVEVKSPTDQLAEQQRFWLERFRELGIPARLLRVRWANAASAAAAVPSTAGRDSGST